RTRSAPVAPVPQLPDRPGALQLWLLGGLLSSPGGRHDLDRFAVDDRAGRTGDLDHICHWHRAGRLHGLGARARLRQGAESATADVVGYSLLPAGVDPDLPVRLPDQDVSARRRL